MIDAGTGVTGCGNKIWRHRFYKTIYEPFMLTFSVLISKLLKVECEILK